MDEKQKTTRKFNQSAFGRWVVIILKFLLVQWQIIGIGVAVVFAWAFPNVGRRGGTIESQ
jgi:hypothetical protein